MLKAKTRSPSNPYTLDPEIARQAILVEFKSVSEVQAARLMGIFKQCALSSNTRLSPVTRIGFIGEPRSGKTELCEFIRAACTNLAQHTNRHYTKGQGVWHDPDIGYIRQADAAIDNDSTMPEADDPDFWQGKEGIDLIEHADIYIWDDHYDYLIVVSQPHPKKAQSPVRDIKIYASSEMAQTEGFKNFQRNSATVMEPA